jgi:DNA gyrase/topoisomerase IV subunit A
LRRLKKHSATNECIHNEIDNKYSKIEEIETALRREIEDLKNLRRESQAKNERLTIDLEDQRLVIEQLTQNFEVNIIQIV